MTSGPTSPETGVPTPGAASRRPRRLVWVVILLLLVLAGGVVASVAVGSVGIRPDTVVQVFAHRLFPGVVAPAPDLESRIVWEFRLPRALLAALVGAGLAVAGAVLQAVVRNPLADPYVFGVSSGASVGAVLMITVFGVTIGWGVSMGALIGAFAAMIVVFLLAQRGGGFGAMHLVLAGVAISYILSAITSYLVLRVSEPGSSVASVLAWLAGSLGGATWDDIGIPAIVVLVVTVVLAFRARTLNAFLTGDELAASMGVDVPRARVSFFFLTSIMVGVVVAVSGAIGFVGLLVPHAIRAVLGADHRMLVPVSALAGAALLVVVDIVSRVALAPSELPVGVLTALLGGPFFLFILRRTGARS